MVGRGTTVHKVSKKGTGGGSKRPKIVTTEYMDEPLHEVLSPFRICLRLQKPVAYLIGKITKHKQMTSRPLSLKVPLSLDTRVSLLLKCD